MRSKKKLTGFIIRCIRDGSATGYIANPEDDSGFLIFPDEKAANKYIKSLKKSDHYSLNGTIFEVINLEEVNV